MLCSWSAEEYGLLGSTEWVEGSNSSIMTKKLFVVLTTFDFGYFYGILQEMQKELNSRAVVYLNLDVAVAGNYTFRTTGTHSLEDIVFNSAKKVQNPNKEEFNLGRKTVYDTWYYRTSKGSNIPK